MSRRQVRFIPQTYAAPAAPQACFSGPTTGVASLTCLHKVMANVKPDDRCTCSEDKEKSANKDSEAQKGEVKGGENTMTD